VPPEAAIVLLNAAPTLAPGSTEVVIASVAVFEEFRVMVEPHPDRKVATPNTRPKPILRMSIAPVLSARYAA